MSSIGELLTAAQLPGGRLEAELLLCHCLRRDRSYLYSRPEQQVPAADEQGFCALVEARRAGAPMAYLTGRREFWSLDLKVTEATLIPRPETEILVEWALELALPAQARVADLGTGSGAIALALALERPRWQLLATDLSAAALAVAAENRRRLGAANVALARMDWCRGLAAASLDLLVSNPPYVAAGDPHLGRGDVRFEPGAALVGGEDGLEPIRHIVSMGRTLLRPGGWLLLEHGYDQAPAVRELLREAGLAAPATRPDLAGIPRISGAQQP